MPIARKVFVTGRAESKRGDEIVRLLTANAEYAFTSAEVSVGLLQRKKGRDRDSAEYLRLLKPGQHPDTNEHGASAALGEVESTLRWLYRHDQIEARRLSVKNEFDDPENIPFEPSVEVVYYSAKLGRT